MTQNLTKWFLKRLSNAFYVFLRLFNYYPYYRFLHNYGSRIDLTQDYTLEFTQAEKDFLKACAASYNFYIPDFSMGYRQKPLSLFKLEDVTYLSNTGSIIIDNKPVVESGVSADRIVGTKAYRDFSLLLFRSYNKGAYTTIQHSPWPENNTCLWFIDSLSRAYIVANAIKEPVTLLMWQGIPLYQKQTLEFVLRDYQHISIKYIKGYYKIKVENFYLPSFVTTEFSGYLPSEVSSWLREKIWLGYNIVRSNTKRRVYISRSKATRRRIKNEDVLVSLLREHKFETIWAEELSYKEQIQMFYDAEAVVSPHGAGLTNILFAEQCKVLELHPGHIIKSRYMLLSKGLNFDYTPIIGSDGDRNEDFVVPLEAVGKWLQSKFPNK